MHLNVNMPPPPLTLDIKTNKDIALVWHYYRKATQHNNKYLYLDRIAQLVHITRIESVGKPKQGGLPPLWIVSRDGPSTEFLVETYRDTDWSHCDYDIWRTHLKIHRVDGRDTAYIPSKFHRNSFKNKREISVQHIFQGCLLVTLTFNLRPWNLNQVVSLSRTINQLNWKTMGWLMTEKLLNKQFHLVSPCDIDLWPSYPKMYTAVLQVIIYQLAKYERDPMTNGREIAERR